MTAKPTNLPRRSPQGSGGFSLIELLAVLSIAAILAAVAIPSLTRASDSRAAAAARMTQRDLTQARERAAATGVPAWITFSAADQTYTIAAEDPASPGRTNAVALADPATGSPLVRTLSTGDFTTVQLLAATFDGDQVLGFDWLGRPLNSAETQLAADGQVTFTGGHTITVQPGSGLVSHTAP